MILVLGWVAALSVAAYYGMYELNHDKWALRFSWANLVGSFVLTPTNLMAGSTFGAFISLVFGVGAAVGLWRHYKQRRFENKPAKINRYTWANQAYDLPVEIMDRFTRTDGTAYVRVKSLIDGNVSIVPATEIVDYYDDPRHGIPAG